MKALSDIECENLERVRDDKMVKEGVHSVVKTQSSQCRWREQTKRSLREADGSQRWFSPVVATLAKRLAPDISRRRDPLVWAEYSTSATALDVSTSSRAQRVPSGPVLTSSRFTWPGHLSVPLTYGQD
ncbi:hypothetical protein RRG08_052865 [Elysia crispata]|uniref:Uncharacterized protein n=1 Tax=Elysia crispata TaxID=231223 RepID=A0AAE1A0L6_9GAST|nr:hypothetical protein RRG08_052865 [Elysia crispata]